MLNDRFGKFLYSFYEAISTHVIDKDFNVACTFGLCSNDLSLRAEALTCLVLISIMILAIAEHVVRFFKSLWHF